MDIMNRSESNILISHSYNDASLAGNFVKMLDRCLSIPEGRLKCTSLDGYKLNTGDNMPDTLIQYLQNSIVILLATESSFYSPWISIECSLSPGFKKQILTLSNMDEKQLETHKETAVYEIIKNDILLRWN